jgi:hypothetical protein
MPELLVSLAAEFGVPVTVDHWTNERREHHLRLQIGTWERSVPQWAGSTDEGSVRALAGLYRLETAAASGRSIT